VPTASKKAKYFKKILKRKAKKPNNFLTPTASKKSQICEIWRQKS